MLPALFNPQSVAVVGASHNPNKIGTQILANIKKGGYKGEIYPVNPKGGQILNLPTYPTLSQTPTVVDLAVIAVKPKIAYQVIKEAINLKVKNLIVISAGFKETSKEGARLEKEIQDLVKNSSTKLLGVNCLGLLSYANPESPLNATFLNKLPKNGSVAFASQSGAFGSAVVDWADKIDLGFKYFVSLGNKTDLTENEFLKFWADDDQVKVIALYLENIAYGKKFINIIQEISPKKPVIILMPGASKVAKKAITSHTGSLVNDETVLKLVFEKYNIIRAKHMRQFFKLILLTNILQLQKNKKPGKNSLILTNAGGPGVLASDIINQAGLKLIELDQKTKNSLKRFLPEASSVHNPVDVLGDAQADRYQQALEILTQVNHLDQIFIILTPQTITEVKKTAQVITQIDKNTDKLLVPIFIGGTDVQIGLDYLRQHQIPAYNYIIDAVEAVVKVDQWQQKRQLPAPKTIAQIKKADVDPQIKSLFTQVNRTLAQTNYQGRLDPKLTESLLELAGFKLPPSQFVKPNKVSELIMANNLKSKIYNLKLKISFPWVIKLASSQVLHNTDLKAVYTNINNGLEATEALKKLNQLVIDQNLKNSTYTQIQQQVNNKVEMLVGLKQDQDFGFTLVFGTGGIYANLYQDVARLLLPTNERLIAQALKTTKLMQLIQGYRGEQGFDVKQVILSISKLATLANLLPNLKEADFNPVIINSEGTFVVDAKLIF